MKTFYTLYLRALCFFVITAGVFPADKVYSQIAGDTAALYKNGGVQLSGSQPLINEETDTLEYTIEAEILAPGDTIYHRRYKGFVLDNVKNEGPVFLTDVGKLLKNKSTSGQRLMTTRSATVLSINQQNTVGAINFSEGVTSSGGKTYTVPIPTAPVASSAPQIALAYNSQSGNGVAGYGWNLSGLSAITVAGKSIYYDGVAAPLDLAKPTECSFYLDGTRLVSNTGSLTEYQYETAQGFVLVKKHLSGSNIAYFTVAYPDGRIATFGLKNNTSTKHVYPLTEIKDFKGYLINFEYIESGNNYYVSKIKYGGKTQATHLAEIRFNYVARTDFTPVYTGGVAVSANKLLKSIVSYNSVNGTSELRTYTLTHVLNNVQQLTQIDCKTGSSSLNPLQFAYEYYYAGSQGSLVKETTNDFLSSYFSSNSKVKLVYIRGKFVKNRFNDGLITFPGNYSPYTQIGTHKVKKWPFVYNHKIYGSNCNPNQSILIAPGLSFSSNMQTIEAEAGFQTIQSVDVNGDGVDEIVKVNFNGVNTTAGTTILKITVYSASTGSITSRSFNISVGEYYDDGRKSYSPMSREYFFGDFKGDGKTQLLAISHNKDMKNNDRTSRFSLIDLNTGSRIYEANLFSFGFSDGQYTHTFDVNGDGKTELCYASSSGFKVYAFNGNSFVSLPFSSSLSRSDFDKDELIGDMNGDGKADILIPPTSGSSWTVYFSTGKKHLKESRTMINKASGETYYLMDLNGDGKSDLVQLKNNRVQPFLNKDGVIQGAATGSSVTVSASAKILPANVVEFRNASHFITIEDAYVYCYRFTKDEAKDKLLTTLTDSYGIRYVNDYSDMTENENYMTTSTNRYYPYISLIAPLNLLRTTNIYKDDYTAVKQYYYTWYGAVAHKTGLGFCGFEKVRTIESVENIATEEERNPELFGVTTKTDSPYKTANYSYSRNEGSNKKCNPRMTSASETDKLTGVYTSVSYQYDSYNNPTKITQNIGSGTGITSATTQTYDNLVTSARYLIGQPLTKTVTDTRGSASWINKEVITYNTTRLPATRMTYTGTSGNQKTGETRWTYDANGNVTTEKSAPYNVTAFLGKAYTYDSSGRYLASVTNALEQVTTYAGYDKYGNPKTVTDHKGRVTTRNYDAWGQLISVVHPEGITENTALAWGGSGLYTVTTTATGQPAIVTHYDALEREIRTGNQRFDGQWQFVDKTYNRKGQLEKVSLPFKGSSPSLWNTYAYDSYNRPTDLTEASGKTTTWSYNKLNTTETKNGIATTKTLDASGALVKVTDPGGTITYALRPDGQPTSVTAPGGVVTSFGYDAFGRQTSITDPSAGKQTFSDTYTAAGVLTRKVTDANGKTVTSTYDQYGRVTNVARPEFSTTYAYNADGLLTGETSTNGTSKTFSYDTYDRPLSEKENVPDNKYLQKDYTYSGGNVATVKYTSQSGEIGTEHFTYANGYNTEIKLNGTTSIWKLTEENALGQPTKAVTGPMNRTYSCVWHAYGQDGGNCPKLYV